MTAVTTIDRKTFIRSSVYRMTYPYYIEKYRPEINPAQEFYGEAFFFVC